MADQMALAKTGRNVVSSQPNRNVRQQVPAFLNKLYAMVNDPLTDDLIHWSDEGDSFFVPNHERFGRELLPRFFKHGNFSSFVRQLNMYGFHKVPLVNQGVLHNETENELWQFASPHFQRGQPDLLMLIQRKKAGANAPPGGGHATQTAGADDQDIHEVPELPGAIPASGTRSPPSSDTRALDISAIATTLASIKRHQTALSAELKGLHDSDERLWSEAQNARKRLDQHQDTINRILKFLAGVFGNGAAGPGGHGARVREHAQGDNDGASEAGDSSTALVPRKRPRLMIEHSGSNDDIRPPSAISKGKEKARLPHAAQLEDDDDDSDWAEEHLLVPMDDHSVTPSQGTRSSTASTTRPAGHRRAGSEARIESVATSPAATSVPPTPGIAQVHEVTPTPTQISAPGNLPPTGSLQNAPYLAPHPNMLLPTQQYPQQTQSQALTTNPGYGSVAPLDPSNVNDQAAWQDLLNSPMGMQMFLNAMSHPTAFPPMPPMPSTIPGADAMHGQPYNYSNPYGPGSSNSTGQLVQAAPNAFAGLIPPNQYPGYDMSGQVPMGGMPDSNMLSLFNNNNNGLMPLDGLGAHSAQLSQATDKHKAIDARVDALGQSLNALLGHINMDPATMLPLDHMDAVDASHNPSQANHPIDFGNILQQDAGTGPITGADFDAFDSHPQSGEMNPSSSGYLDEVGTASTASSPNLEVKDIMASNKSGNVSTRQSKRKSDAMEVDDSASRGMRSLKAKKSTRKK
ncbi:stress-responsive transcription factor hsf1 [Tulasnella sp. 427]|nr:stress-responsive transcription factor hsf1 [Tulasnella sp. 427]